MPNLPRFYWSNLLQVSGVVVTSNSQQADYPDDFAVNAAPWKVYRSNSTATAEWWKADPGAVKTMSAALIRGWSRPAGAPIYFQAHATDAFASPTLDLPFTLPSTNPTRIVAVHFAQRSDLRWVRFSSPNPSSVTGVFELGVPFVGTFLELTRPVRPGIATPIADPSQLVPSPDGQLLATSRSRFRAFRVRIDNLPLSDIDAFLAMYDTVGVRTPIFFAPADRENPDRILYGRLPESIVPTHASTNITSTLWSLDFVFTEER